MRAFLLAAGLGTRLRPATENRPKALLPFLNVPLIRRRLEALARRGIREAAVNLHHEGAQIVEYLGERPGDPIAVRFFWEPEILGTAGALKNAEAFLEDEEFLVWNVDAELDFDLGELVGAHHRSGAAVTVLAAANPDPLRFTPLGVREGRLLSVGEPVEDPFLFTGVSLISPRALRRILPGPRSLVADLWGPILAEGREPIAVAVHAGDFFDLGTPDDFLAASLRALKTRTNFDPAEGFFDRQRESLCREPLPPGRDFLASIAGRMRLGERTHVRESLLLDGADLDGVERVERCFVGPVALPGGSRYFDSLLWPGNAGKLLELPLHGRHRLSPAVK